MGVAMAGIGLVNGPTVTRNTAKGYHTNSVV